MGVALLLVAVVLALAVVPPVVPPVPSVVPVGGFWVWASNKARAIFWLPGERLAKAPSVELVVLAVPLVLPVELPAVVPAVVPAPVEPDVVESAV
jgi:hypothetical protein